MAESLSVAGHGDRTPLGEKVKAGLFALSPFLALFLWRFGSTKWPMLLQLAFVVIYSLFLAIDLMKKQQDVQIWIVSILVHGASLFAVILFFWSSSYAELFYEASVFLVLLSYNIRAPVANYQEMVNYVKVHKNTRGFQNVLLLNDLDFGNSTVSPLDIAITKQHFWRYFVGDFYSSRQSAIMSVNLSFSILGFLVMFLPTGTHFANTFFWIFSYSSAFILGLVIRIWLAKEFHIEDLIEEVREYLQIEERREILLERINRGMFPSFVYGILLLAVAFTIETAEAPIHQFSISLVDGSVLLMFPMCYLLVYLNTFLWRRTVWTGLSTAKAKKQASVQPGKKGTKKRTKRPKKTR